MQAAFVGDQRLRSSAQPALDHKTQQIFPASYEGSSGEKVSSDTRNRISFENHEGFLGEYVELRFEVNLR